MRKAIMFRCVSGDYLKIPVTSTNPDIVRFNRFYYHLLSDITIHGGVDNISTDFAVSEIVRGIAVQQPEYLILSHHCCCKTISDHFDDPESEKIFYYNRLVEAKQKAIALFPYFLEDKILLFYLNRESRLIPVDDATIMVHNQMLAPHGQEYKNGIFIENHSKQKESIGCY